MDLFLEHELLIHPILKHHVHELWLNHRPLIGFIRIVWLHHYEYIEMFLTKEVHVLLVFLYMSFKQMYK